MSGFIPENILEDILSRIDIVELIAGYIPLKRAGRNFKAHCPFHHEKTPSFMVSAERQIYHCFGCGAGGNAFNFLMQYERMSFLEAVEVLAKKAGVALPDRQKLSPGAVNLNTELYKINELAVSFYENNLSAACGLLPRSYLKGRGINDETIKLFRLGYALDKWDALINHLRLKNINLSLMEKAGLVLAKEGGGYYDRFRNRILFPIFDIKSRPLGFGARVLNDKDNSQPKYINSPETLIYSKGRNLYGLNFTKDSIREANLAVIVEGYLDFIIPYQAGLHNIVASLGTALTIEQAHLLKRYTDNVVMVYDPDTAGQMASLRTLGTFIEEGIDVKVVSLPEGYDPDLYVRKNGIDSFKEAVIGAQNLLDYMLKILKTRYNSKEIEGKAKIISEILPTINKFKNAVLKSEYVRKLAEDLKVEEDAIWQEINKIKKEDRGGFNTDATVRKREINVNPTERLLIKLMLEESDLIERIRQDLTPGDFRDAITSKIASIMFELIEQGKSIEPKKLLNYFQDESVAQLICESSFMTGITSENKDRVVADCIQRLKNEKNRLHRQRLHDEIKLAQRSGDEERLHTLIQEFHDLIKKEAGKI